MSERPSILLIMTDQQRGDCLSIDGHPCLMTPNMDSIAGAGVRFRRAYTSCPSCIAARRSLLSGQFPSTHGMVGYHDGIEWDAPPTLPQVLRDSGYETALVGRSMHQHPDRKRYGYDTMTIHGWESDYTDWLLRHAPEAGGLFGSGIMHCDWTAHPWPLDDYLHQTNWTTERALEFLHKHDPSCPFFLTVSYLAPHPPLLPPAFYMDRYLDMDLPDPVIGDWAEPPENGGLGDGVAPTRVDLRGEALRSARAAYYGMINHVDDQIRRLLNPLLGVDGFTDGNTIVVFASDHGEFLGDHYLWQKFLPHEGSARIPLLIRAPERFGLKTRSVVNEAVCLEDVMPTLLEMTGIPVPDTVEGKSLLPLMQGEKPAWRDFLPIEHAPFHQSLTDGHEKFVWYAEDGREQFFDLDKDPDELHDFTRDPGQADRIAVWRRRLVERLAGRPEGQSDGERLIPGRRYVPAMPHAGTLDTTWKRRS